MITGTQYLHHLHCQRDEYQLSSFCFRNCDPEVLLTAPHDHVLDDMIDRVVVHSGSAGHDVADFVAMVSEKLCSARMGLPSPSLVHEHAI